jgi:hypothetical protein
VNKNCPVCGTSFNVGPRDEGKQFPCFKCNTPLTVTRDGIQAPGVGTAASGPMPVAVLPLGSESPPPRILSNGQSWWRRHDGPTWLFGLGAFFVILFLFLPLIDYSKKNRARGALDLGNQREKRRDEEYKKNKNPSSREKADREEEQKDWDKERTRLEAEHSDAGAKAAMSEYWYTWGMMFGFLLLGGAALGYLDPAQPPIRRVVGAVVLVGEVLLIFLRYVFTAGR